MACQGDRGRREALKTLVFVFVVLMRCPKHRKDVLVTTRMMHVEVSCITCRRHLVEITNSSHLIEVEE